MTGYHTTSGIALWAYKVVVLVVQNFTHIYHYNGIVICDKMTDKKREATSIKIDPDLWKEAKIEAIKRDIDLSDLVEESLRKELKRPKQT